MLLYTLDENDEPVPEPDTITWALWLERNLDRRRIARTEVGMVTVSTVFLGVDHNWFCEGDPILFETMVFGDPKYADQRRYRSAKEARAGHEQMVAIVRARRDKRDAVRTRKIRRKR